MALLSPPRLASDRFAPGTYYTDGTRLLQMLPALTERGLRAVEDCRSLDIMLVSLIDLESMGLRPVEGSGAANRPGRGPCP